jgi:hypothetical protein
VPERGIVDDVDVVGTPLPVLENGGAPAEGEGAVAFPPLIGGAPAEYEGAVAVPPLIGGAPAEREEEGEVGTLFPEESVGPVVPEGFAVPSKNS